MLAASHQPLASEYLNPVSEPRMDIQPWNQESVANWAAMREGKLQRFLRKPLAEKVKSIKRLVSSGSA
jgi:hypothetical protein